MQELKVNHMKPGTDSEEGGRTRHVLPILESKNVFTPAVK